jgi:hypothetical protein
MAFFLESEQIEQLLLLCYKIDSFISRCVSGIALCQGRYSSLRGWCSTWGGQPVIPLVAYSELSVPFRVKTLPFLAVLCDFQNPTGPEQLQQVAGRTHQSPLAAYILFATQAEAAKTTLFLDLSPSRGVPDML